MPKKKSMCLALLCFCFYYFPVYSQCISTGALSGAVTSNETSIGGISWNNTANAQSDDNNQSSAASLVFGDVSNYLLVQDFGFSIPSYAIICGITVNIEKKRTGIFQNIEDFSVQLYSGGVFLGDDKAIAGNWPSTAVNQTHGANNDMWGTALTYTEINDPDFGLGIAVTLNGSVVFPVAEIDVIEITIFYDPTLPIELLHFEALEDINRMVKLNWSAASEINNDYFIIEDSNDAQNWNQIITENGAHNASSRTDYSVLVKRSNLNEKYYRLSQVDFDGTKTILEMAHLDKFKSKEALVFPNPSKGSITIMSEDPIDRIRIYNLAGQKMKKYEWTYPFLEKI